MIKRIKRIVNEIRDNQRKILYAQEQIYASNKLLRLLPRANFIPETGWSMTPKALEHCLNLIQIGRSQSIIEFGSGASTIYIAQMLKNLGGAFTFYSVESDLSWKNTIEAQLFSMELSSYVEILHCPLNDVPDQWRYKEQQLWYDITLLKSQIGTMLFDFVLVDGPFGGSSPFARYSAYPFLNNNSHKETIWLLDDTNRPEEYEILKEWHLQSSLKLAIYNRYGLLYPKSKFDTKPYAFQ